MPDRDSYIAPNGDKISSILTLLIKEHSFTRLRPLAAQKSERLVSKALMVEEMEVGDLCIWQEAGETESFGGIHLLFR